MVVNRLTKFSHFHAISATYIAVQVADLFFREILKLHKMPRRIFSDRNNKFLSIFW